MNNQPLIIIGPSGAGKSSVVKILCKEHGFTLVKTVTTRPQRDKFDTDHVFVSVPEYNAMKQADDFFGTLDIFGAFYGLPKFTSEQKTVLLLRAPAVAELLERFPEARIIEIEATLSVLEERLSKRGSAERFEPGILEKEMQLGRALAHKVVDSSDLSVEAVAKEVIT